MTRHRLILASQSPRRKELLAALDIEFDVLKSEADESSPDFLTPAEIAQWNAFNKARWVASRNAEALIMGADTVVTLGSRVYGKPADLSMARQYLNELQGKTHQVVTGIHLCSLKHGLSHSFAVTTTVQFRPLSPAQISSYLDKIQPLDKAGGYAIQEFGEHIVARIWGSLSNVVGLPVETIQQVFKELGLVPAETHRSTG